MPNSFKRPNFKAFSTLALGAFGLAFQVPMAQAMPISELVVTYAPEGANAPSAQAQDDNAVWDLRDIYPSVAAWAAAREAVASDIAALVELEGQLGENAQALLRGLDAIFAVYKEVTRIYVYTSLNADEDIGNADANARRLEALATYSDLQEATSWVDPELLSVGSARLEAFLAEQPELAQYRVYIDNVLRGAPHTLSPLGEQILAAAGKVTGAPSEIYTILANADMPWPTITLSTGEELRLSQAGYGRGRQLPDRNDRQLVFDQFWGTWKAYESTFGAILGGHLKALQLETRERGYDSSVARAFFGDAMPPAVYETLIHEVNLGLPTLHRYFRLRKRMLGLDGEMGYYDIYPPLVQLDKTFSYDTSIDLTRQALAPLGEEYLDAYNRGVQGGWVHVYPAEGKRSGAYMNGSVYDVHPYVLLNHNDDFDSASTFAHEYGHAVHSVLANAAQPWPTAGYSTFIAETASIMNEMLLQDMVIAQAQSPEERLFYLGSALEGLRGTYFRQAMFAEFEFRVNALADQDEALTGARMTDIYLDLLKRYHGHDDGVVTIDDLYGIEWAYIPHFYYDFYVFQYATSIAAASSLAEQIGSGDADARARFIALLKAGGSDHPYELMKQAGVDLANADAHRALIRRANAIMDDMEAILAGLED